MVHATDTSVFKKSSQSVEAAFRTRMVRSNALERLIQIMNQNEELLTRLRTLGDRLSRAQEFARDPNSNRLLAETLLEYSRSKYSEVLALVRANRAESLGILRACGQIGPNSY
jgi:hypothetical protein